MRNLLGVLATMGAIQGTAFALTLEEVWARALEASPQLRAVAASVEEKASERKQAGRWANPNLILDTENVGGSGPYSGTDSAEVTLALEVPLELGGKRAARTGLADWEVRQSELGVMREQLKLRLLVETRFIDWLEADALADLARKRLEVSSQVAAVVATRSAEGAATGLDRSRTEVDVSRAETEMQRAQERQERAARLLYRLWNAEPSSPVRAGGSLEIPETLPTESSLREALGGSLQWKTGDLLRDRQEKVLDLARSAAWPDLSVTAGHRWLEATKDDAWVVGVSMSLPIFDRNRDGVEAATAGLSRAAAERAVLEQELRDSFEIAYGTLSMAYRTARRIADHTLPPARETYRLVTEGYRLGRYDLLYLLEAEQTLFEVETDLLQNQAETHRALAHLNYLLNPSGEPGHNLLLFP